MERPLIFRMRTLTLSSFLFLFLLVAGLFLFAPRADAKVLYWRGTANTVAADRGRWEDKNNWSTIVRGPANWPNAPKSGDTAVFSFSGTSVIIRSNVNLGGTGGIIMTNTWTGSILNATGSLRLGTDGWRVGSGTYIGGLGIINSTGALAFTGGVIRNLQANLNMSGSMTIGANTSFTATGGTIIFSGNGVQTITIAKANQNFNNMLIHNIGPAAATKKVTFATNGFRILGTLTVSQGTFDAATNAISTGVVGTVTVADSALASFTTGGNFTFSGNLIVKPAGTFLQTAGTSYPNGLLQTLSGSMTFYALEKVANDSLFFYPGSTYTISNFLNTIGVNASSKLTLASSISGSQWTISQPSKTRLVYATISDSINTTADVRSCLDCTNGGNNVGWSFEQSVSAGTSTDSSSGSSGGGGGGGGGSRSATANVAAFTDALEKKTVSPSTAGLSNELKGKIDGLVRRADVLKKKMMQTTNKSLKSSMQRGVERIQKLINSLAK